MAKSCLQGGGGKKLEKLFTKRCRHGGEGLNTRLERFRVITDCKKFKKVFDLDDPRSKGLPNGMIKNEDLDNIQMGDSFSLGSKKYLVLPCSLQDYIMEYMERKTQIIYPKDAGYITLNLDLAPGQKVGEAGTGSGALTAIFSRAVGPEGLVYTYERRPDFADMILRNLEGCQAYDNILFHNQALEKEELPEGLDAFFLDMKSPWEILPQVDQALKPGGRIGFLLPTTNQVTRIISILQSSGYFIQEVAEILRRGYKPNPERLRPQDVMTAHTGYLIFACRLKKRKEEE